MAQPPLATPYIPKPVLQRKLYIAFILRFLSFFLVAIRLGCLYILLHGSPPQETPQPERQDQMNAAADLQKAIPPVDAIQITLPTAQDALAYQALNGGWVFVADQCSNGFWFNAKHFTAGAVMRHTVLSGKSGKLI